MREQIDTIPVSKAYETADECPFCCLERQVEKNAIRYTVGPGASYMEPEVRGATDRQGFCREHFKKMYDYGNSLGNALIMQTYLIGMRKQLEQQLTDFKLPSKKSPFSKKTEEELPLLQWVREKNSTCFLCSKIAYNMRRYYTTFFHMIKYPEFRTKVEQSKGVCMHHFEQLLEAAQTHLHNQQREWFYGTLVGLMQDNLSRIQKDLDWFVDKFDYRNASAPWRDSKDAVSRTMQKLKGGYPADAPYKQE